MRTQTAQPKKERLRVSERWFRGATAPRIERQGLWVTREVTDAAMAVTLQRLLDAGFSTATLDRGRILLGPLPSQVAMNPVVEAFFAVAPCLAPGSHLLVRASVVAEAEGALGLARPRLMLYIDESGHPRHACVA